jgi:hypothetical protein
MESINLPWTADSAMRDMWSGLDKNASNGEVQSYFRKHLQAAYDAGVKATERVFEAGRLAAEESMRNTSVKD